MRKKYIRTEDKIYKVKGYYMIPLDYPKFSVEGSKETFYEGNVEGADTIEELCDTFVVKGKSFHICLDKANYETCKDNYIKDENITIYGCIWIDKGLKYVAKMNKEGELELL